MSTEISTIPEPEPSEPSSLVRLALERGMDVHVLEKLVGLEERVSARNARAAYFEALAGFQEQCPEVAKSRTASIATASGGSYTYNYSPLEIITRTIRPLLRKHGLSYSWSSEMGAAGMLNVLCTLRHIDGHAETSAFPVPTETMAKMSGAQKNGAAMTYGKRQSLLGVLGITTADEPDTDGAEDVEYASKEDVLRVDALIDKTGSDRPRFLKWLGVDKLDDMTTAQYRKAIAALGRKAGA